MPTTVSLITTYELGHQPFGVASAAAALRDVDASVTIQDLSINSLDEGTIGAAEPCPCDCDPASDGGGDELGEHRPQRNRLAPV